MKSYLLVNFGGPRNLNEIESFLRALLNDEEVIWPKGFKFLHHLFFTYIAKKRAVKVRHDYIKIGGKSPIYEDTEILAKSLEKKIDFPVITFHRYLTKTHQETLKKLSLYEEIVVFPLFPQFSYATTGSAARFFCEHLDISILDKMRWVKSYADHEAFIYLWQKSIRDFVIKKDMLEEDIFFIFSAHGLPKEFVEQGDPYQKECELTVKKVAKAFPRSEFMLTYQSQFGKAEWIKPSTLDVCNNISAFNKRKKVFLFVPISFTSDHIETLFEIEEIYLPLIKKQGLKSYLLPALLNDHGFVDMVQAILKEPQVCLTQDLLRQPIRVTGNRVT